MQSHRGRPRAPTPSQPQQIEIDVLVVNAADLIGTQRASWLQRIQRLGTHATQNASSVREARRIWLLLMTHTRQECWLSSTLTGALATSTWCRGVRAVVERHADETARAALDLHRLHFPFVPDIQRPERILVLGSARERQISQLITARRAAPIEPSKETFAYPLTVR